MIEIALATVCMALIIALFEAGIRARRQLARDRHIVRCRMFAP